MFSTICDIVNSVAEFFSSVAKTIGLDLLFIIALAVEALIVLFFLVKSAFSYESALNRSLDKINFWLFERKTVTEENIKELNYIFKTKAPKRLCYYWQQYILFRENNPSAYLSTDNLIEKPLKTSSYNSNIKNLSLFSGLWALVAGLFVLIVSSFEATMPTGRETAISIMVPIFILIIGVIFVVFLRARKNAVLNSLYQNVTLFGRFMDNACLELPSYIDYQILFTPEEIEKGQPVLREFLDYKARKEKEEFNKAKEDHIEVEKYNFEDAGIDGSIVLERAMKESELFLKKKEKILVKISQLEGELDSRRKNFDNVQKDYQTKLQASKENVTRLRQMQEETTNRIESNYYRKQQTQEVGKQEQLEQEFEGLRAKYLLEKNECEDEIKKLNAELEGYKKDVEIAMKSEYSTFFDRFCKSAEKVVGKVFEDKINNLKAENERDKQTITDLEIKIKNMPQGEYDGSAEGAYDEKGNFVYPNGTYYDANGYFHDENGNVYTQDGQMVSEAPQQAAQSTNNIPPEGMYDEQGNYLYPNGTYYDVNGYFHDEYGNVFTQDGQPVSSAQPQTEEKKVVDFENLDAFELVNDESQKEKVFDVAESVVKNLDKNKEFEIKERQIPQEEKIEEPQKEKQEEQLQQEENIEAEETEQEEVVGPQAEEKPRKKAGRPRKVVKVEEQEKPKLARRPGRPRKIVLEDAGVEKRKPGRPKKVVEEQPKVEKKKPGRPPKKVVEKPQEEKRKPGRPKKAVEQVVQEPKRAVGRPKKVVEEKPVAVFEEKKKPGRPKKIVSPSQVEVPAEKRGRGRPKKVNSISDINKQLSQEEENLKASKKAVDQELKSAIDGLDNATSANESREDLLRQIDALQAEAQEVMARNGSDQELAQINTKLEELLKKIQNAQ